MALTSTEEAQTRALIAQNAALLSLAESEATIISKLGATKVSLADLTAATSLGDADLFLVRQGTTEKSVTKSVALNGTVFTTGDQTIDGVKTFSSAPVLAGVMTGPGGGSIATNTRYGVSALGSNTTGANNTATGVNALSANTSGSNNTSSGSGALGSNTTGIQNAAVGVSSLAANTTGSNNTATGVSSLAANTTGTSNTASGQSALGSNTTGGDNTANGVNALLNNTTGNNNTANGVSALESNTTGSNNTASGVNALRLNTTGSGNTAINPHNSAGTYAPVFNPTTENNRFCMGSTSVTNAYIQVAWTVVSDARDKTDFAPVPHGLDFVNKLKPTAYRYKIDRESTEGHGPLRYGFKAQQVLELEGDNSVIVDNEDLDKLRFNDQALIAVLVNAVQELSAKVKILENK